MVLAGLRAEVATLKADVNDLQQAAGRPVTPEWVQKGVARDREQQEKIYLDACKQANIDPDFHSESDTGPDD